MDLCGCILGLVWVYPRTCDGVFLDLAGLILSVFGTYRDKTEGFHEEKPNGSTTMASFHDDQNRLQLGFFRAELGLFRLGQAFSRPVLGKTGLNSILAVGKYTMLAPRWTFQHFSCPESASARKINMEGPKKSSPGAPGAELWPILRKIHRKTLFFP